MNERAPSSFLLRERSPIVPMTQLGTRGAAQTSASPKSISKQILVSKGTLSGDRDTCYFSNAACPRVANNCLAPRKEQTYAGEAGVPAPLPRHILEMPITLYTYVHMQSTRRPSFSISED